MKTGSCHINFERENHILSNNYQPISLIWLHIKDLWNNTFQPYIYLCKGNQVTKLQSIRLYTRR